MTLAFSSSDSEILNRNVEHKSLVVKPVDTNKLKDVYELARCSTWIEENNFKKVALQFPDNQLVDSVEVALKLEECTQAQIFILGDVTYGSCCADFISAQHAGADCLIHFGPSCLSPVPTGSIPVLFVFVEVSVDIDHIASLVQASQELSSAKCLLLLYETNYAQASCVLGQKLSLLHPNIVVSTLRIPGENSEATGEALVRCQRIFSLPENVSLSECTVFYLGNENMTQSNLIMNFSQCPFYTYNPSTEKLLKDCTNINLTLRRRFYIVERLKDAQIIGILVGTLGIDKYLAIVDHLKALIKLKKKRSYVLAVGKPNVPKLANFPEIEAFVLVACQENSLLDSKEYLAPIATPFELELALNSSRTFQNAQYITDFCQLLPGGMDHVSVEHTLESDEGDVSLVTGKLRYLDTKDAKDYCSDSGSSLIIRNGMALATLHARAGGEHLAQRSWQGLEQQLGMTPVTLAKEGQSGIAAGYEDEG